MTYFLYFYSHIYPYTYLTTNTKNTSRLLLTTNTKDTSKFCLPLPLPLPGPKSWCGNGGPPGGSY